MESLKGNLLVAANIYDPNFRHTVVLIADHDDEGALGVVLNQVSGVEVAEAVPPLAPLVPAGEHVYLGGPVQPQAAVVLADIPGADADRPIFGTIGLLTGEVDGDDAATVRRARVYAGYAGWGPGQLESELIGESWVVEEARPEDVFTGEPEELWSTVLKRKGGRFALLATMPYDPSTN